MIYSELNPRIRSEKVVSFRQKANLRTKIRVMTSDHITSANLLVPLGDQNTLGIVNPRLAAVEAMRGAGRDFNQRKFVQEMDKSVKQMLETVMRREKMYYMKDVVDRTLATSWSMGLGVVLAELPNTWLAQLAYRQPMFQQVVDEAMYGFDGNGLAQLSLTMAFFMGMLGPAAFNMLQQSDLFDAGLVDPYYRSKAQMYDPIRPMREYFAGRKYLRTQTMVRIGEPGSIKSRQS